jgi:hypothetical protein
MMLKQSFVDVAALLFTTTKWKKTRKKTIPATIQQRSDRGGPQKREKGKPD